MKVIPQDWIILISIRIKIVTNEDDLDDAAPATAKDKWSRQK